MCENDPEPTLVTTSATRAEYEDLLSEDADPRCARMLPLFAPHPRQYLSLWCGIVPRKPAPADVARVIQRLYHQHDVTTVVIGERETDVPDATLFRALRAVEPLTSFSQAHPLVVVVVDDAATVTGNPEPPSHHPQHTLRPAHWEGAQKTWPRHIRMMRTQAEPLHLAMAMASAGTAVGILAAVSPDHVPDWIRRTSVAFWPSIIPGDLS